jgi:hypothetical protein
MKRRKVMKLLLAWILSASLVVFTTYALAAERGYVVKDNEELYCIWINLSKSRPPQKQIFKPDGTFEFYSGATKGTGRYLITGKWNDSQNNIFYRYHVVNDFYGLEFYVLAKISNSGNTLETLRDSETYPTEIEPEVPFYRKYTRK